MAIFEKDGLTLVPELMDDAVLRSNLINHPVEGRDEIAKVLQALEDLYVSTADIYRRSVANREYIITMALLDTGQRYEITVAGLRDDTGWIASVIMHHSSAGGIEMLASLLSAALAVQGNRL